MRSPIAALALSSFIAGAQADPLVQREFSGRDNRFIEMPGAGFRAMAGGRHIRFDAQGMSIDLPEQAATAVQSQASGLSATARSLSVRPSSRLRYSFEGGTSSAPQGVRPSATLYHWLVGQASEWRTGLRSYGALGYRGVWPGIDAVFQGEPGGFKYQFELAPGADAAQVWLRVEGATDARILPSGALEWSLGDGHFTDDAPLVYQMRGQARVDVPASYRLERLDASTWRVGFTLGSHDKGLPLVIDPAWTGYSGLVGGNSADQVNAVVRDGDGNTYACGVTRTNAGGIRRDEDAFVVRFAANGTPQAVTYLGGNADDACNGLAIDFAGRILLAGGTESLDFPLRGADGNGGLRRSKSTQDRDAFVARLASDGASIDYSGLVGGSGDDQANGLAVDWQGRAYVTGFTAGNGFPAVNGPSLTHGGGPAGSEGLDAFVARVDALGTRLEYAGYLGGDGGADIGHAIAVDGNGSAYVVGATDSSAGLPAVGGFRTQTNARDTDASDGFAARISEDGRSLVYFTLLTGAAPGADRALALSLLPGGSLLVGGETESEAFPADNGGARHGAGPQTTRGAGMDGFLLRLGPGGDQVPAATYLGGGGYDSVQAVASDGMAWYATGSTSNGTGFPTRQQSGLSVSPAGKQDGFLARIDAATPASWSYAGFLGTSENDAMRSLHAATVQGWTILSVGGATTTAGLSDGLVLRIDPFGPPAAMVIQSGSAQSTRIRQPFAQPLSVLVTDVDGQPLSNIVVSFTAPASTGASTTFATTATATTNASGIASLPAVANQFAGSYAVTAVAGSAQATLSLTNDKGTQDTLVASAAQPTLPYGGNTTLGASGGSGTGAVSYAVTAGAASCAIVDNTVTATAVGSCTVTVTKAGDANYLAATTTIDLSVVKAQQPALTATATPGTLPVFGTAALSTSGGAGSGAVGFAITDGAAFCSVNGTTLTAQGTGSCTVTATRLGDANFHDAIAATVVTVTPAAQSPLSVQAAPSTVAYGSTATLGTTGGSGSGAVSYQVTDGAAFCSLAGDQLSATGVGTCTILATKAGDANHQATSASMLFTVTRAAQATLSVQAVPAAIAFGGSSQLGTAGGSGTGSVSYGVSGPCSIVGTTLTGTGVGACTVTATKAADASYEQASATTSVTVSQASQALLSVVATPSSITKGATSTVMASGGSGTGAVTYALTSGAGSCSLAGTTVTGTAVGNCTVTATKAADANHAEATASTQIVVGKSAQSISFVFSSLRYLHPQALSLASAAQASSGLPVSFSSLTSQTCVVAGSSLRMMAQGQCTVRASQAGDAEYAAAAPVDQSFMIELPPHSSGTVQGAIGGVTVTAQIATGSPWVFTPSGTGPSQTAGFIALQGHARSPADAPPAHLRFPLGLFDFTAMNGAPGSAMRVTLTYPDRLPDGAQYWKYGPTTDNPSPHWYRFMGAQFSNNTVTLTIEDGKHGDDDMDVNAFISDPGGVAVMAAAAGGTPAAIPALSLWGRWLLVVLMAGATALAMRSLRQRRTR
ncbi:Beta-propeller repeat [Delftia tsuruhatensis]|uniref:DUF7948 domain-containing protein n=1 Tax=Delftia tsuruhatensis TaxID=180282 RepID=UPI001E6C8DEF|nr:choice-of-anchor U domain-containing protein [Delftia tsuruhatensis]CAB5660375.1 Beta-propeller repeat [Delftia tsuruhatensis]CAC9679859.1 Beta-propeller repeat [Delftia tsuruhatensis]